MPIPGIGGIASAVGSIVGGNKELDFAKGQQKISKKWARKNFRYQKKAAKKSVRWKTADVIKAGEKYGIHPLALLGMQTHSPSAIHMGGTATPNLAAAYSAAGQGIGSALDAYSPSEIRNRKQSEAIGQMSLERASLENDLLRARIASEIRLTHQPGSGRGVGGSSHQDTSSPSQKNVRKIDLPFDLGQVDASNSPAEDVEREYADIVSNIYGVMKITSDAWKNFKKTAWATALRKPQTRGNQPRGAKPYRPKPTHRRGPTPPSRRPYNPRTNPRRY